MSKDGQGYRWGLALHTLEGKAVGKVSVSVNWGPAREWTRLLGIRRGLLPADAGGAADSIRPLWHPRLGRPYVEGFRLSYPAEEGEAVSDDFTINYFMQSAMRAREAFVELGKLRAGESFLYHVLADPETSGASRRVGKFHAQRVIPALPLQRGDLAGELASASPPEDPRNEDLPVLIPRRVLEEVDAHARAEEGRETGGFLIGHLFRDEGASELYARVSAQVPARYTEASAARLSFTPETWTAVEAAIALRGMKELPLAWWHSHVLPEHCRQCAPEKRSACSRGLDFFSEHDETVHRAMFAAAYSSALVATEQPHGGFDFALYGWRKGLIESRGFHILEDSLLTSPAQALSGAELATPPRRSR